MSEESLQPAKAPTKAPAKAPAKAPIVGDIVHYHGAESEKQQPYPALVTHVFNESTVNLHLFTDPTFPGEGGYKSSVIRGAKAGCWSWPKE
jgi:hypothetical protein